MSYPETPSEHTELSVDPTAFLPEGVSIGESEPEPTVDTEALSQVERDLDAVDAAIAALDAGTYGIHPTTGEPISDALLAQDPTRLS